MYNKYLQLGIFGIAEDKEFNDKLDLPTKQIRRVKLAEFIRHTCRVSGRAFARAIGVSAATVSKWLYTDTMPSITVANRIATIYGMNVAEVDKLFEVA